ncbi:MAG: MBL fold metallo-hydrolase, partial [Chloroflexota bacterium]|nr:MBL fold metallo-hydrolase [Chloroflexota bacterium]
MRISFLGTAAGERFPDAFCGCQRCQDARREGGRSLRLNSAALINDELLIDFGPDIAVASMRFGIPLYEIPYAVQTHPHDDHLDRLAFSSRSANCQAQTTRTHYFCSAATLRRVGELFGDGANGADITDRSFLESLNLTISIVEPWQEFSFGPYRIQTVAANHGAAIEAMLFAIAHERGGQIFYGTDTGPLPPDTWPRLAELGWLFDVLILDHTFGFAARNAGHLNAEQFLEEVGAA